MKPRFQADADLNEAIVRILLRRRPEIDFRTATEAGLAGVGDPEVLRRAAKDERIVVSHDRKTMPRHFGEFLLDNRSSGLIIVSQKLSPYEVVDDLLVVWEASTAEEWVNRIASIPL